MNNIRQLTGVALVIIGALLLIVGYMAGFTSSNLFLLGSFILILVGAVTHIKQLKKSEKY